MIPRAAIGVAKGVVVLCSQCVSQDIGALQPSCSQVRVVDTPSIFHPAHGLPKTAERSVDAGLCSNLRWPGRQAGVSTVRSCGVLWHGQRKSWDASLKQGSSCKSKSRSRARVRTQCPATPGSDGLVCGCPCSTWVQCRGLFHAVLAERAKPSPSRCRRAWLSLSSN